MNVLTRLKMNISSIGGWTLNIASALFGILSTFLLFASWDELKVTNFWIKLSILFGVLLVSFLFSCVLVIFVLRRNRIWRKGKNSVSASYGDLMKLAFNKRYEEQKIVVIPVNDTFDTKIEIADEKTDKPLVSKKTLHGAWIEKFCSQQKISDCDLDERIQASLKKHGAVGEEIDRKKGNKIRYKKGTVAIVGGNNNTIFYLLAISSFNDKNNAQSTKKELRDSIDSLIKFYDENGQGIPMFLPLMGTGSSRVGITHEQSLKIIKSSVLTSDEINGSINIVVYNGDKDKVSIFD